MRRRHLRLVVQFDFIHQQASEALSFAVRVGILGGEAGKRGPLTGVAAAAFADTLCMRSHFHHCGRYSSSGNRLGAMWVGV